MTFKSSKQFRVSGCKGAGEASTEQLVVINGYTLKEMGADEVYVRTMYLAHNGIDRDKDVMDDALLRDFARTLPGKGLFIKHPLGWDGDSGPGEGRFFEAAVKEMSFDEARQNLREPGLQWPAATEKALVLEASFYAVRTDENKSLLTKIDGGVAGDVSIGFSASERSPITDVNDNHIATRLHAPGEAFEGSLVWLGAQPGARIHKNAKSHEQQYEDNNMDWEQKAKDLDAKLETTKTALATAEQNNTALKAKADGFDTVCKALGDDGMKADSIVQLATDGKAYRDDLVGQVVTAKRHLKMIGDKEEDVVAAKALYAAWPIEAIKAESESLTKQVPAGSQIDGGEPNAGGAGDGEKGLRDASVTHKAMGKEKAA